MSLLKKLFLILVAISLAACLPQAPGSLTPLPATPAPTAEPTSTSQPKRPEYNPGELVDFLLGFATIDIFDDDQAAKARQESAEKSRESLGHPVIESQQPKTP